MIYMFIMASCSYAFSLLNYLSLYHMANCLLVAITTFCSWYVSYFYL